MINEIKAILAERYPLFSWQLKDDGDSFWYYATLSVTAPDGTKHIPYAKDKIAYSYWNKVQPGVLEFIGNCVTENIAENLRAG